ncbi:RCC1 and BTB domain-containing protein 1 [Camponotus floridanus]|uniref:RCC1 and BTB domain-containing protein 1 n=1 Tax=Camponotus floridanus TaxID=104421 RepID=E2AZL8_CAMFO|nr:RCC1 and BTB domain-containing protein 1 [Camponotus floridanus]
MSIDLKRWPFFHLLKSEFIPEIHMVMLYGIWAKQAIYIIVKKNKNVYSLYYNKDEHSEIGDIHTAFHLKKIEELCGKNIKTFACSCSFVLALTAEGEVYCWKFDKCSFTVRWPIKYKPIRVSGFSKKRVVDIACGNFHFLVLTSDGEVYTWEDNICFVHDGIKDIANFDGSVRQVKHGLEKNNVVHIACGTKFNMVITDKNKLYGWGKNKQGQISTHSIIHSQEKYVYPRKIITFSDKIVKLVCGDQHTLALTNKGNIYAWGNNDCGQVGVNNRIKSSDPILEALIISDELLNELFSLSDCSRSIFEGLCKTAPSDDLTSDFIIQVEGQPIYVHKIIIKIRSQHFFFRIMFHHDGAEDVQSTSDTLPVYTISNKFSYVVYKAFLKYLYTGTIDLPLDNALELMELAEMYCETNLKKDCSQIIKQTITVSNVEILYNKAIEYNAEELKEFCFQFIWHHTTANILSEDYIKLDMSTQAKFIYRAIQNDVTITSSTFSSPNQNVKERNLEITTKKREMQKYEKKFLQCVLAEKIIPIDLKRWLFFHVLKPEFIPQIHMVMVYDNGIGVIIVTKCKNVYSLDYKEEYLKTGDTHTAQFLKEIQELRGKNIKTFAHSSRFILALTEEGEVCQSLYSLNK